MNLPLMMILLLIINPMIILKKIKKQTNLCNVNLGVLTWPPQHK